MGTNYTKHYQTKQTSQSQPIPGSGQVKNSAGGYAWAVDDWKRLDRFLILGCETSTYYASERKLTIENAEAARRCIESNGQRAVKRIVEISESGSAPKNDPAIFALAMAAAAGKNADTRKSALEALPKVARIGTHLFSFLQYAKGFRGWGRGMRKAVASWYDDKAIDKLAYQVCKYQQRGGWSNRDVLRLAHPKGVPNQSVYKWITHGEVVDDAPKLIHDFTKLQISTEKREVIGIISENKDVTWEMIPTQFLALPETWDALLPTLPMTAMIRNLGRMTANGLLVPMSKATKLISERLINQERIKAARVHPIAVLGAMATYQSGHGARGSLAWSPVREIVDALDSAFYLTFGNVEPMNKRVVLALDVSGSMGMGEIAGMPGLTPRVASAAMALVTAKVEKDYAIVAFCDKMVSLDISPRMRLDDVVKKISGLRFGGTDCALPMLWALEKKVEADIFCIYTDNETWDGKIHPSQALDQYRRNTGIPARLVTVGMTATEFTIADPKDAGQLDCVGFDTATPNLISSFTKGEL